MGNKLVYIIILNWNGWQDTVECVESCLKLSYSNYRILLVDNGSKDGSEEQLRRRFPKLEFIQTGTNLGFAGGNNVGMKYAMGQGADYIWLLNNDTVVDSACLQAMVEVAEAQPQIGVVGSKIYYYKPQNQLWFAGGKILWWRGAARHIGEGEEDRGQYDHLREIEYATGCSILFRVSALQQTGLFDERFFLYFEETDLNMRLRDAGYKVAFAPGSKLWHKIAASSGGIHSPGVAYYSTRNRLLFMSKHGNWFQWPSFLCWLLMGTLKWWVKAPADSRQAIRVAALEGLRDYLSGKFGPRGSVAQ